MSGTTGLLIQTYLDASMMGARGLQCCYVYLRKRTNPGATTEIFLYVTHNTIDCELQKKPGVRCNEHLLCQTMLKYAQVTLLNKLVCVQATNNL